MKALSIVIPVHNEGKHIGAYVEGFNRAMDDQMSETVLEVILVENGSTDDTLRQCQLLAERCPSLIRVLSISRGSYGEAIKHGMMESRGTYLSILECDFLDVGFVKSSFALLSSTDARFVLASKRHPASVDDRPWTRRLLTRGFNRIINCFIGYPGSDTHGLKSMDTELARKLCELSETTDELFQTEIVLIAWRLGVNIEELPIHVAEKRAASVSVLRRLPKVLDMVVALRKSTRRFANSKRG